MNRKACLAAAWMALVLVGGAREQFKAAHVFATGPTSKNCTFPEFLTRDRFWGIAPKTRKVIVFNPTSDSPQD